LVFCSANLTVSEDIFECTGRSNIAREANSLEKLLAIYFEISMEFENSVLLLSSISSVLFPSVGFFGEGKLVKITPTKSIFNCFAKCSALGSIIFKL
jgi:hypothetical protein